MDEKQPEKMGSGSLEIVDSMGEKTSQKSAMEDPQELSVEEKKRVMRNIMKNVILIAVAFLMNFNAYQGLARLQSTLNIDDGIG